MKGFFFFGWVCLGFFAGVMGFIAAFLNQCKTKNYLTFLKKIPVGHLEKILFTSPMKNS